MSTRSVCWDTALTGVVPPLISPLAPSGEPDAEALAALVEHVLRGGATGLFVLGGCGEGAWLTLPQRAAVVRAAVRAARGRVPVLAGVMLPATGPAAEAARQVVDEGADAVVAGSPYYLPVDASAQQRHVEALLAGVNAPLLLYNIPQATHHVLAPATVATLAREDRVLGIKDSAGDFRAFLRFLALKHARPSFRVLQGDEALSVPSLLHGADGLVPGLGNLAPGLFTRLRTAARQGDAAACARLQAEVDDLGTLFELGHWLPALKAACAMLGIGNSQPAPPLAPAPAPERAAIHAVLRRHVLPARD